eukprot:gene1008-1278_t
MDELLTKGVGMSIKIRPTRKVTWDHLYKGFEKNIAMMLLTKYGMNLQEIGDIMDELKSSMKYNQEISTTSQIDFVRKESDPGFLILYNEKVIKEINDQRFSDCFFEFYLGSHSKVPEARTEFYNSLWNLMRNEKSADVSLFGI